MCRLVDHYAALRAVGVPEFLLNVFMTEVFSALAYWWISRLEKRQAAQPALTG
ncbi:hypothetical protein WL1483_444 [Aeromonas schubertii]|uniref:Uncharacterized protein n=1 Tax=Aeromonas schubertii TaxID=652 RepID=A0A0S2SDS1_9GAMM|nr:hypothetical protein WL1483_444 [Aeromonas schubertii]